VLALPSPLHLNAPTYAVTTLYWGSRFYTLWAKSNHFKIKTN
jgi:hypothetical protein